MKVNIFDGWENVVTGLGTPKDKTVYTLFRRDSLLSQQQCCDLYHYNDLAKRIIEAVVKMATRRGFKLKTEDQAVSDQLMTTADELGFGVMLAQAACMGRTTGAGAILMNCTDGGTPEQLKLPLDPSAKILNLLMFDGRDLAVDEWEGDIMSPRYGQPKIWRVTPPYLRTKSDKQANLQYIHASRLIVLPGAPTAPREKSDNNGLDFSVLQALYGVLRDFNAAFLGVSNLLYSADQNVFKLKDLAATISTSDTHKEELRARIEAVQRGMSTINAIIIDSEDEFLRLGANFASVPEVLDRFEKRISAACEIPTTVLFGSDPKSPGLNATGDAALQLWYDNCAQYQRLVLEPAVDQFFTQLSGGNLEFNVIWPEIDPNSELVQTDLRSKQAQIDKTYVDLTVLDPSELRDCRFTDDGFSTETTLDPAITAALKQAATEQPLTPEAQQAEATGEDPRQALEQALQSESPDPRAALEQTLVGNQ